jgi:hypothetical protein
MAKCAICGQEVSLWSRDLFTRACPRCQAGGTRPAGLIVGLLILIALLVLIFSPGVRDLGGRVAELLVTVDGLKQASDQ